MRRTVRDSAVVGFLEEAIGGKGVADSGVLRLGEVVVDGVVEALVLPLAVPRLCGNWRKTYVAGESRV